MLRRGTQLIQLSLPSMSFLCQRAIQQSFSRAVPQPDGLNQLRNIDYNAKKLDIIRQYNQILKKQKQSFNKEIDKYEAKIKLAKKQTELEEIQNQQDIFLANYSNQLTSYSAKLKTQLDAVAMEEKTNVVKLYLAHNLPEEKRENKKTKLEEDANSKKMFIPNRLIMKKLYNSPKKQINQISSSKQILLAGIQKEQQHSVFLCKLIEQLNIKNVITMIPPDLPYFIKTERSFNFQWQKFLESTDYARKSKFYINPKPKCVKDICLQHHHIPLVKGAMAKSNSFLENYYCMQQQNQIKKVFEPNPLLVGMFAHNVEHIYFADYPVFEERKMIANRIPLDKLRDLFQQHLRNINKQRFSFSAQWLFPKQILSIKLNHLIGIARAISQSSQQRSIILCPSEFAELISIEWQLKSEQSKLNYNYHDNNYYFNFSKHQQNKDQTFIEFVQKLVILDLIIDPVFTKYFIRYRSFPFLCEHTIGGTQNVGKIFIVWMHFYKTYYEMLTEKRLSINGSEQKKREHLRQFEDPTNFT